MTTDPYEYDRRPPRPEIPPCRGAIAGQPHNPMAHDFATLACRVSDVGIGRCVRLRVCIHCGVLEVSGDGFDVGFRASYFVPW